MLVFTIREAIENATLNTSYDMIVSLLIPLIFSIAFTPIAYLTELYSTYRLAFMRIRFIKDQFIHAPSNSSQ